MVDYRTGSHTVFDIKYHLVWVTKYRYSILVGEIGHRVRDLIRQICMTRDITIIKGHVSPDHIHLLVSCPPNLSVSQIIQYIKGKSSRLLQQEYSQLHKQYWGRHLWARGYFCATTGTVTDEMVKAYIDQQDRPPEDTFRVSEESQ